MFNFYSNSALTATLASPLVISQATTGEIPAQDVQIWLGSTTSGETMRTLTNPGTDQLTVSISDSSVGTGASASMFKLALTQGGLASASGGNTLNLGTTIQGGVANAVTFWLRCSDTTGVAGNKTDCSLVTNLYTVI